jgi:hypothetical protein
MNKTQSVREARLARNVRTSDLPMFDTSGVWNFETSRVPKYDTSFLVNSCIGVQP